MQWLEFYGIGLSILLFSVLSTSIVNIDSFEKITLRLIIDITTPLDLQLFMAIKMFHGRRKSSESIEMSIDARGYGTLSSGALLALSADKIAIGLNEAKHQIVFLPIKDARKYKNKIHKLTMIRGRFAAKVSLIGFIRLHNLNVFGKRLSGKLVGNNLIFILGK